MSGAVHDAYYEALVFCLGEIGQPSDFSDTRKQQMLKLMVSGFPTLPAETQQALANARTSWTQYHASWQMLSIDQKKAFALDVLSLAYGDAAASQALGLNTGSSGDGTYEVETYDSSTGNYGYSYE